MTEKMDMVTGKRTALARAIIMIHLFRRNIDAGAPILILKDFARIIRYHVNRLTPQNKETVKRFRYSIHLREPCHETMKDREVIHILGHGYYVSISRSEYLLEDKIRTALAHERLRKSGFFELVRRVVEDRKYLG